MNGISIVTSLQVATLNWLSDSSVENWLRLKAAEAAKDKMDRSHREQVRLGCSHRPASERYGRSEQE